MGLRKVVLLFGCLALLAAGPLTSTARADGDPGSDVLVYQPLFIGPDAGVSVDEQVRLGALLRQAQRRGFPIRVAIISSRFDLGSVTELWRKPRAYARFLGLELSLAYRKRLLVVMPNGFGFNWPRHSTGAAYRMLGGVAIRSGGNGLAAAAQTAVKSVAAAEGVKLTSTGGRSTGSVPAATKRPSVTQASRGSGTEVTVVIAVLAALSGLALAGRVASGWRPRRGGEQRARAQDGATAAAHVTVAEKNAPASRGARWSPRTGIAVATALVIAGAGGLVAFLVSGASSSAQSEALARNPSLDPGTPVSRPAPDFTLTDQFGHRVSVRSFRGKVVLLAFNDSECTTVCPLTTTAMLEAKAMLGPAAARVQLLGIDANPKATALGDVLSYSQLHGMLHAWHFLTGSLAQLKQVWKAYGVAAEIEAGQITHTPALYLIDPQGRERRLYLTQQSYAAVGQLGQLLAQEASRLLPGHPPVHSNLSYAHIAGITPAVSTTLPRPRGGVVRIGPGRAPRLYLFFATWDREVTSLAGQLEALNRYEESAAPTGRLPSLTAIDEGSVEPTADALTHFLAALPHPLSYPVAIDRSGRLADGYQVQGEPWFVLTSRTGRILWYWEVSTSGWLTPAALTRRVRTALAHAPSAPASASAAQRALTGSPHPLAALHQQAGQLLGGGSALVARVRALRGYPVVINAWASWCLPCRNEFGLFASASARFGRQVAFMGADTDDSPGDARSFLAMHFVSYPSYQTTTAALAGLTSIVGLPTTVFLNRSGNVVYVHSGQYETQGTLDEDIETYADGR